MHAMSHGLGEISSMTTRSNRVQAALAWLQVGALASVLTTTSATAQTAAEPAAAEPAQAAAETPAPPTADVKADAAAKGIDADIDAVVLDLMAAARDPARVALSPVKDDDDARAKRIEKQLLSAFAAVDVEVVTPASVRRVVGGLVNADDGAALSAVAADHVLLSEVIQNGAAVTMRLMHVTTGVEVASAVARVDSATDAAEQAKNLTGGLTRIVDDVAVAMSELRGQQRYQRLAVMPLEVSGDDVAGSKVDVLMQTQLTQRLRERGFLVVERTNIKAALNQLKIAATVDNVDAFGEFVDAQALVFGSVAAAGDALAVNVRVVSVEDGEVLGTSSAMVPRAGTVSMASDSLELRTAEEALFRSLVAPGWGQFYNQSPVKGVLFSTLGYGSLLTTLGLGAGAGVSFGLYNTYEPGPDTAPADAPAEAKALREQTNILIAATGVMAAVTTLVWAVNAGDAYLSGD